MLSQGATLWKIFCVKKVRILWLRLDWYYAAARIAKIYATQWECSMYDEGDDFIVCGECGEAIYLDDYLI